MTAPTMTVRNERRHPQSAATAQLVGLMASLLTGLLIPCHVLAAQAAPAQQAQPVPAAPIQPMQTAPAKAAPSTQSQSAAAPIPTEDDLRRQLTGKTWYLRGRYLGDSLRFSMRGELLDHADTGSYTLCLVRIDKVQLTHKRLELEGTRYALHFLGALPYEDPQKSVEEIAITPKKKFLRITIDRQPVVKPKKSRADKKHPAPDSPAGSQTSPQTSPQTSSAPSTSDAPDENRAEATDSPAVAAETLNHALERIFAPSLDAEMLASLPDDWQLYYAAQRSGHDYLPDTLPASAVDRPARLLRITDPPSNSYAQANGIAGRALYRVLVSASGRPERIAILRPIGFGLDENAVAAIQSASFAPAVKSGQPVAETLDIGVMFRIYSKLTDRTSAAASDKAPVAPRPSLPGPYSVK